MQKRPSMAPWFPPAEPASRRRHSLKLQRAPATATKSDDSGVPTPHPLLPPDQDSSVILRVDVRRCVRLMCVGANTITPIPVCQGREGSMIDVVESSKVVRTLGQEEDEGRRSYHQWHEAKKKVPRFCLGLKGIR